MNHQEFLDLISESTEARSLEALENEHGLAMAICTQDGPLEGATSLHWSGHRNYSELTKRLINLGVDINTNECKWGNHSTPLQWAADAGKPETCQILVDNGAKIDYHEGNGFTALHSCAWGGSSGGSRDPEGYAKTAKVLLEAGFDKNGPGPSFSALTMALHVKNQSVVKVLENVGAIHVYDDPKIRETMKEWK
ncbi:MAG: hypothetical protein COA79_12955 [Planctomycetota bacterium]|nr:MAG: hypothetical protein COA79_12955 [Planctomycetota bacterium]